MAAAQDSSARDGDCGSVPTVSEHARTDEADIICPDVGTHDGESSATRSLGDEEVSDSDDEEYVMPQDELLTSDDSDDDDSGDEGAKSRRATRRVVEVERDNDGERAGDDDVVPPTGRPFRFVPTPCSLCNQCLRFSFMRRV